MYTKLLLCILYWTIVNGHLPSPFDVRIDHHKVEIIRDLIINTPRPQFSWKIHAFERNVQQTAYQFQLDTNTTFFYDTGRVTSSQSVHVPYTGENDLISSTYYHFRVRVWTTTNSNEASDWTNWIRFRTAIFNLHQYRTENSTAHWIGSRRINMNELRKEFTVSNISSIKSAIIYISGIGYYELYINGHKVDSSRRLDPGWTSYEKRTLVVSYDLTSNITTGANALGVKLGHGWYTQEQRGVFSYGPPRLLLTLSIDFENGDRMEVNSDSTWLGRAGPIRHDSIYNGEIYDSREDRLNWTRPGFEDPLSLWITADILPSPLNPSRNGSLALQDMLAIRAGPDALHFEVNINNEHQGYLTTEDIGQIHGANLSDGGILKPLAEWKSVSNVHTFDLGQTIAGLCRLKFNGTLAYESPKQTGRHRDSIWVCFDDMGPAKTVGHRKAQCKYCLRFFNFAKLNLMYSHIAHQCDEVVSYNPNVRKEMLLKMRGVDEESSPSRKKKRTTELESTNSPIHTQYTMDRFTSRMISNNEQQNIDRCLLRAVIMNGMSFRTVNNNFFVDFIKKLNPSYVLPGRKKLANEILTEEMALVESKNESLLGEAAHLTLNIDGWNDRCGRSLYEYNVITDNRKAIVLSLLDISTYHHTAEFLVQKLESVLARISTNINVTSKIRAIVTDNPTTMRKMRELFISKPGNQHIIELRCFAHAINLIVGDILKHHYAINVLNKTTVITKFQNQSHLFKAKLKEEAQRIKTKKEALHTISKIRWSSVADCLHSFIILRAPLEVIVAVDKTIAPARVINIINNRSIFYDIENLYKILKPLAYAMSIIQSASITLADCYLILSYLQLVSNEFVGNTDTRMFGQHVKKAVNIRLKEFQNDLYLSAYYLHPKYRGSGMLTSSRSAVYRFLAEYSKKIGNNLATTKNVIGALQRYEIKSGSYALTYTEDDTPMAWWTMINDNTHKNALSNIALQLFSITPHSVMPERLFSILDWQHTKPRNRLSPFTLEAIAKIHTFYKNGATDLDDEIDVGQMDELLRLNDDLTVNLNISEDKNNLSADVNDFIKYINDSHDVLRDKCEAECLQENDSTDSDNIPELICSLNTQDRQFQQLLVDIGLLDNIQTLSDDSNVEVENDSIDKASNEDYDVEELLSASMALR